MPLLSIRMRASLEGRHISGAERIIEEGRIPETVCELLKRPKGYDRMIITLERVSTVERIEFSLPVSSFSFPSVEEARNFALDKLVESGVPRGVAERGMELLSKGANPKGGNMRGAVLMDILTGERLERDRERGVRTVRMDWEDRNAVREKLLREGFTERTLDALAVATKNVHCGVLTELCWSDDPDYLTGYVASQRLGYIRITPMKEKGDPIGGRIYFVDRSKVEEIIECLERKVVLIRYLHPSL